jgi:hypothetical protein
VTSFARVEQRVQVRFEDGPRLYTYSWFYVPELGQNPLSVGDWVVTPANWRVDTEGRAEVMALGSDWTGPCRTLVRRIDAEAV